MATKKPHPIPWTHQETVNLIRAYQEKWSSAKMLRASQWEEVAVTVAARCGYDYHEPSKSALQCRHKMEKLRQRYRAERQRINASGGVCVWPYFGLMDQRVKIGPLPISARPLKYMMPCNNAHVEEEEEEGSEDDEEEKEEEEEDNSKSRSINHILRERPTNMDRPQGGGFGSVSRFLEEQVAGRRWGVLEEDEEDDGHGHGEAELEEEEKEKGRELVSELATEIKAFTKRFLGMENLKMEMMKETERCRLEMENRRMDMILKSQQRMVASIGRAFESPKKMKYSQEI